MTSRPLVLAAGAAGALVVVLAVVSVAREQWVLAAAAAGLLALGMFAVQLDTWRRVRGSRTHLRQELDRQLRELDRQLRALARQARTSPPPAAVPAPVARGSVHEEDLRGALTMMQTQHAARLDRLQTAVEQALTDLADARADSSR